MIRAALLAAALAAPLRAQDAGPAEPPAEAPPHAGWVKTASSLLLYDSSGTLVNEIGLGNWEDSADGGTLSSRAVRGGVSADARFAWTWERTETVRPGRSKNVSTARMLRYFGSDGKERFFNELADAPEGLDPVVLSADGGRMILTERGPDAWIVAVYGAAGERLLDARGRGSVELASLTPDGRYALVRWHQLDRTPEYALLKVDAHQVAPLALDSPVTSPRLADDGRVFLGDKVVATP